MRIAVFGPSGMLGKHVIRAVNEQGHVAIPMHDRISIIMRQNTIEHALTEAGAEAVINCAGVIPIKNTSIIDMIAVNSMFPHMLVGCTDLPILLMSTDCVFSGRNRYKYRVDDVPDPRDYYGKSKALGEVVAGNSMVVRTSFIGCEHGLMNMVLQAGKMAKDSGLPVKIQGWKNAKWTGSTVQAVADKCVQLITESFEPGICHLSTENTSTKFEVVSHLVEMNEFDVQVEPVLYPIFNRALAPTVVLEDVFTALNAYKCARLVA